MFSHLYASSRAVQPVISIAEADAAHQVSAAEAVRRQLESQLKEQPFELDAADSEFNPWHHGPLPIVGQVPHRWEKTLGSSRMFFDAEPRMVSGRKRRSLGDCPHSPEPPSRKRKLGFLMGRSHKRTAGLTQSAHTQDMPCATFSNVDCDQGVGSFETLDVLQPFCESATSESMTVIRAISTRATMPMPSLPVLPAVPSTPVKQDDRRQW